MSQDFQIRVFGNVADRRTESEVYIPRGSDELVAVIYETDQGWVVEPFDNAPHGDADVLRTAIESAKDTLGAYVNRKGKGAPAGLTVAGLSLWLMTKVDGTAMGRTL